METETTTEPTKKTLDRKAYMKAYRKKRLEDPEYHEKLKKSKRDYHRDKTEMDPDMYGLNTRDALTLRAYYKKMMLLEPTCVADIILEFGLPEMAAF